jgi:arginase family enzyme
MTVFMVTHDITRPSSSARAFSSSTSVRHDPHAPDAYGATITYDLPLDRDGRRPSPMPARPFRNTQMTTRGDAPMRDIFPPARTRASRKAGLTSNRAEPAASTIRISTSSTCAAGRRPRRKASCPPPPGSRTRLGAAHGPDRLGQPRRQDDPDLSRGELPHYAGINTFLKAPYIEDVTKVGAYDAAVIGIPFDGGTTYRPGTRFGPQGVRKISALYTPYNYEMGIDLREQMTLCDVGDVFTIPANIEKTFDQISRAVSHVASSGALPIMIGGDHSIGFPCVRGIAQCTSKRIGIVHFDRHIDIQEKDLDERMHTTPWFHATDLANVPAVNLVQVGIGGWQVPREGVQEARKRNTNIFTMRDIEEMGLAETAARALELAWKDADAVYISFDIDSVDCGFVPGTGWPEPGGFLPREALELVSLVAGRHLRAGGRRGLAALRHVRHHRPAGDPRHRRRARHAGQPRQDGRAQGHHRQAGDRSPPVRMSTDRDGGRTMHDDHHHPHHDHHHDHDHGHHHHGPGHNHPHDHGEHLHSHVHGDAAKERPRNCAFWRRPSSTATARRTTRRLSCGSPACRSSARDRTGWPCIWSRRDRIEMAARHRLAGLRVARTRLPALSRRDGHRARDDDIHLCLADRTRRSRST